MSIGYRRISPTRAAPPPPPPRHGVRHGRISGAASALSSAATAISKLVVCSVAVSAAVITLVSVHNMSPVGDPITPIGFLDRLSLALGVHQQSAVVVVDVGVFGSTVYTYVFHRHVSDGSFHVASETKKQILPGMFDDFERNQSDDAVLLRRANELVGAAMGQVPARCFHGSGPLGNPPLLAKIDPAALRTASREHVDRVVSALTRAFSNSSFAFNPYGGGIGTLSTQEERVLQWFAVNLLTHTLRSFSVGQTAAILNVGAHDVEYTVAVSSSQKIPEGSRVKHMNKLSAFGHSIKLLTLSHADLGLYKARFKMLTANGIQPANDTSGEEIVHSECMNPISQAHWHWSGRHIHVLGKERPDYELVKERNGPFAGKKVNRPVANYDQCHNLAKRYLADHLTKNGSEAMRALLRGRSVFMEGLLLEKCMERGLTLPYRGGDVRMKSFIDSLNHACKVPNTDQPFGCVDLMYLASFVDAALAFKQSSILRSSCNVNGMTGEWPLAAAFYVYENGL